METWVIELNAGRSEAAWDLVLTRYRRLIFASIRHYAEDHDDVMDVFASVCEALRTDDLKRLRTWASEPHPRAQFSTWLVTVVRHLTIDWYRHRDGRPRISALAAKLPPIQRAIFEHVFLERRSHIEAYELLRTSAAPSLTFGAFLAELRATYQAVVDGRHARVLRELGPTSPPETDIDSSDPAEISGRGIVLDHLLTSLNAVDRTAVQLYVVDELPAADIARIVGLPNAKAVYNRVYRALAMLRERLAAEGIHWGDL